MVWPTLGSRTAKEQNRQRIAGIYPWLDRLLSCLLAKSTSAKTQTVRPWCVCVWPTLGSRTVKERNSYGLVSILCWLRCDMLRRPSFGSMDGVMSAYNGRNRRRRGAYIQCDSTGCSVDLTPRRVLKLTHRQTAPDRGRSLISTFATPCTRE